MDLLLQRNTTALWHYLIQDAQKDRQIYLTEPLEIYLVDLLTRFCERPEMADSVLGLEFLQIQLHEDRAQQEYALRDLGDKCLLFAGLFPGRAERKHIGLSYFVHLGKEAYQSLACMNRTTLFEGLCREFISLREVLAATRPQQDLLQTIDLWQDTHDAQVYEGLVKGCNASVIIPAFTQKH